VNPSDHTNSHSRLINQPLSSLSEDEAEIEIPFVPSLEPASEPESATWNEQTIPPLPDLLSTLSISGVSGPTPIEASIPAQPALVDEQGRLPALRVIGQFAQSYIITEGQDGLYLVDQHAAHERILLERMVKALQERASLSQLLLTPMVLKLAPLELTAIEEHLTQLEKIGFDLELRDVSLLVRAVPQVLLKQINARSLQELLTELTAPEEQGHAETWEEHALANVACKAAIKANYFLTVSEMREMLTQLAQTRAPYSCCHGRPTTVRFGLAALEREFGRR
jgi:DNA mismatch repair protein MutL